MIESTNVQILNKQERYVVDLTSWVEKAVGAVAGWAAWITVKTYQMERVMLTRDDHERICEKRHAETVDRFNRMEEKQEEMLKLMIDVIRK